MIINSFPKVYNLGHPQIKTLFDGAVDVEEKVDGSQFSFGIIDGELFCRSKNNELHLDAPVKMFELAVKTIKELKCILQEGLIYRCEYLIKPKHNSICYDRVPEKNLIIYDMSTREGEYKTREFVEEESKRLCLECVPIFRKQITLTRADQVAELLNTTSVLGDVKIEGLVFKARDRFGQDGKPFMGKYVSKEFKEKHKKEWRNNNPTQKDVLTLLGEELRTEARFRKAIQHLQEQGLLTNTPKDIGLLKKEIQQDTLKEEEEYIKERFFNWAQGQISRSVVRGFPEWYKEYLLNKQFEE